MQSTWAAEENHAGPHFTLTVFPDGKAILTTPSYVKPQDYERIQDLMRQWVSDKSNRPLFIGQCLVQVTALPLTEISVVTDDPA